jgi:hypothetical protein
MMIQPLGYPDIFGSKKRSSIGFELAAKVGLARVVAAFPLPSSLRICGD